MARSFLQCCVFSAAIVVTTSTLAQPSEPAPTSPKATKSAGGSKATLPPLAEVLTGAAKDEYMAGKLLYETKDFANAVVKFRKAYSISPEPRLLKNIAVCEKDLRHYARSLALLQEYRAKAGDAITPDEDESLRGLEEVLRGVTSMVTLTVNEPGATILVDGEVVGTSPLTEAIRLDVGERKITVQKAEFKTVDLKRTIDGGTALTVAAKLERDWQRGKIVIEAGAKDAIAIDGKVLGLGRYEGFLKVGGHSLRVSAPGMATYQSELTILDGESRRIPITLNPLATDNSKWLWIGGGVVLAAGAAIGAAFLFKPTPIPPVATSLDNWPTSFGGRP